MRIKSHDLPISKNEIFEVYGQYSAWKLRDLTHEEAPWKNNQGRAEF